MTRAAAEDVSRAATWALLEPVGQPAELQVRSSALMSLHLASAVPSVQAGYLGLCQSSTTCQWQSSPQLVMLALCPVSILRDTLADQMQ